MKIATQSNASLAHVAKLIDDIPIAMFATIEADGAIASRPMAVLEMDVNGALWFFTDLRSSKAERLQVASLSFTDQSNGTYVSLSGRAEIHTDRVQIERLWTPFAKPWFPDGPESPNLGLLKFVPDIADYWDAPSSKMVRAWGMLASMVAGKPIAMGEHGSHTGLSSSATATGLIA